MKTNKNGNGGIYQSMRDDGQNIPNFHLSPGALDIDGGSCDASSSSSLGSNDPLDRDWLGESLKRIAQERAAVSDSKSTSLQNNVKDDVTIPLTIVTWNIWFSNFEWRARLEETIWQTLQWHPDVFCFQEVTEEVHNCMLRCEYLRERYEPTEVKLSHGYDVATWVKKCNNHGIGDGRTYHWCCGTIPLESVYGRRGLQLDLEISVQPSKGDGSVTEPLKRNVRVVTAHLESGRKLAATRKMQLVSLFAEIRGAKWKMHDRTGTDEMSNISTTIDANLLVGDFNFDEVDPENELVTANGEDLWALLRPNEPGFTVDSRRNMMGFYAHQRNKQARYDRVIMVSNDERGGMVGTAVQPLSIALLGNEPFHDRQDLWPSDHFGLVAQFDLSGQIGCPNTRSIVDQNNLCDGYTTP